MRGFGKLVTALVASIAMLLTATAFGSVASAMGSDPEFAGITTINSISEVLVSDLVVDDSDNMYIIGSFEGTADFDGDAGTTSDRRTSSGVDDAYVASYDSTGGFRWVSTIGGAGSDSGNGIAVDAAGTVYVTGLFQMTADFDGDTGSSADQHTSPGGVDAFIASYDSNGTFLWSRSISAPTDVWGADIALDGAGNLGVTGSLNAITDFDGDTGTTTDRRASVGGTDGYVASYDTSGMFRWATAIGGTGADVGLGITADASGNFVATGEFFGIADFDGDGTTTPDQRTSNGDRDIYVASYDSSGVFRWASSAGSNDTDQSDDIVTDAAGNSYFVGTFRNIMDFDGDIGTAGDQLVTNGSDDIYVASYDSSGAFRWSSSAGSMDLDQGLAIALDPTGTVFITGFYQNTADFDGDSTTTADRRTAVGNTDMFVASYDGTGGFQWVASGGGFSFDQGRGMAVQSDGDPLVAGFFESVADFDEDLTTAPDQRTSLGGKDVFIVGYSVLDLDGDGAEGPNGDGSDCDDGDPLINPSATDIAYNGIDEDCSGADLDDADGDGSPSTAATGGTPDCNDSDPTINPGAAEIADDGIDQDCDGVDATGLLCDGLVVTIDMNSGASGTGTAGDDVILGTPGDDIIDGLAGDDTICGEAGDDTISGGDGLDFIYGGDGNDTMTGGLGNDRIRGQQGIDDIDGGVGNDFLYGGIEGDTINGGDGNDTIGGFGGADTIDGGSGNDRIFGGFGADLINGGAGDDNINGLIGNDTINGDDGNDQLKGDQGLDTINGGNGDDVVNGGNSVDTLNGDDGNDSVNGGKSDDTLSGGPGTDTCTGNSGTDTADATCETTFGVP